MRRGQITTAYQYLLILICATMSVGCQTLSNLSPETIAVEPLEKSDFAKLNGRYCDAQDTVFGHIRQYPKPASLPNERSLARRLFFSHNDWHEYEEKSVELTFTSQKKATVSLYQNDSLIYTKYIRGKFRDGYFYVRPKILFIPFFPVFYVHRFERARLGKMGNDLVVDHSICSTGFALLGGGSNNGRNTAIYRNNKK